MRYYLRTFLLSSLFILVECSHSTTMKSSSLENQHLIVAAIEYPISFYRKSNNTELGNDQFDGVACMMFKWLSAAHINTTYTIIPINPWIHPLDSRGDKPGIIDLVANGTYDIMASSVPTFSRVARIEYTHPDVYVPVSYLIPVPDQFVNILSYTKPFETWVWISLFLAIFAVLASVMLISSGLEVIGKKEKRNHQIQMISYVLGVLLHQAVTYSFSKKLEIRIIIAIWSLAAFIIINFYSSLCISFLAVPVTKPLIKSIHELRNNQHPDIRLVTGKNLNIEALLLSAESGLLKDLGDRIRADPGSLCAASSQCVDLVKEGRAIYTAGRDIFLLKVLKEDFEATGKCNMQMSQENYLELQFSWALQKKSPHMDSINKSFMRMREAGLIQKWYNERLPNIADCLPRKGMKTEKIMDEGREPLSLQGFTGAFIMLAVGSTVALIVFIVENNIIGRIIVLRNNRNVITI